MTNFQYGAISTVVSALVILGAVVVFELDSVRAQPQTAPLHGAELIGKVEDCHVYRMFLPIQGRSGRWSFITVCPQGVSMTSPYQ